METERLEALNHSFLPLLSRAFPRQRLDKLFSFTRNQSPLMIRGRTVRKTPNERPLLSGEGGSGNSVSPWDFLTTCNLASKGLQSFSPAPAFLFGVSSLFSTLWCHLLRCRKVAHSSRVAGPHTKLHLHGTIP